MKQIARTRNHRAMWQRFVDRKIALADRAIVQIERSHLTYTIGCTKIALFFQIFKNSQYFVPMILYDHHTNFEQIP